MEVYLVREFMEYIKEKDYATFEIKCKRLIQYIKFHA